jgi:Galactose oxidase, central domain
LTAGAIAVLSVVGVLGVFPPAVQASPFLAPTWTRQAPASSPPARADAAIAYDAATGTVVLFGGSGANGSFSDTWTWDGSTWSKQNPAPHPGGLTVASMAYDAATRTVVLFGGANNSRGALSDTWTWDGSTWARQNPAAHPSVRTSAAMAYDVATGNVVLFGGVGTAGDSAPFGDTWIWG